jgi:hypothetical protein
LNGLGDGGGKETGLSSNRSGLMAGRRQALVATWSGGITSGGVDEHLTAAKKGSSGQHGLRRWRVIEHGLS